MRGGVRRAYAVEVTDEQDEVHHETVRFPTPTWVAITFMRVLGWHVARRGPRTLPNGTVVSRRAGSVVFEEPRAK